MSPDRQHLPWSALVGLGVLAPFVIAVLAPVEHLLLGSALLDVRRENNLPTWLSSAQFAVAAVAALAVVGAARGRRRAAWVAVTLLCLLFSIDETASLHEEVGYRAGEAATLGLLQPAAAVVVVVLLVVVARTTGGRAARAVLLATASLATSQVCASVGGLATTGTAQLALEFAEETTEVLTAVLLLAAALLASGRTLHLRPTDVRAEWLRWWRGPVPAVDLGTGPGTGTDAGISDASHRGPGGSR